MVWYQLTCGASFEFVDYLLNLCTSYHLVFEGVKFFFVQQVASVLLLMDKGHLLDSECYVKFFKSCQFLSRSHNIVEPSESICFVQNLASV